MKISKYSNLTDQELDNLHVNLTAEYGKMLWDTAKDSGSPLEDRKNELVQLIGARKVNSIREFVKEYLFRKLKELASIIYVAMDKNHNFGDLNDKMSVTISFCRNILNLPSNRLVTQFDVDRLFGIMEECDKRNGYKTGEEYSDYIKNYSLSVLGKSLNVGNIDDTNDLGDLLGADYFLWATLSKSYTIKFIFGKISKYENDGNKYWIMEKEYIRSPQFVLSIAAEVYRDRDTSILRRESCKVIYTNKWAGYFSQSYFEHEYALFNTNCSIKEGFRKYALRHYGIGNKIEAFKKRDAFIDKLMICQIVLHEGGHVESDIDLSEKDHYLNTRTWFCETDNAGHTITEMLADWSPQKGPFARFCELAKTDPQLAMANIYVYLSDYWFLDEDEDNKYSLLSYVSSSLVMQFILSDGKGTVDSQRLNQDRLKIYAFLLKRFKIVVDRLHEVVKTAHYDFGIKKLDFPQLEQRIHEMDRQESGNAESYKELDRAIFWSRVWRSLKDFSKEGWELWQKVLAEEAVILEQETLDMVSQGNGSKYNNSLRTYIVERAKETGIMEKITGRGGYPVDTPEIQHSENFNKAAYLKAVNLGWTFGIILSYVCNLLVFYSIV